MLSSFVVAYDMTNGIFNRLLLLLLLLLASPTTKTEKLSGHGEHLTAAAVETHRRGENKTGVTRGGMKWDYVSTAVRN